jgi:hypothetical protein
MSLVSWARERSMAATPRTLPSLPTTALAVLTMASPVVETYASDTTGLSGEAAALAYQGRERGS